MSETKRTRKTKCPKCGHEFNLKEGTKKKILDTLENSEEDLTFETLLEKSNVSRSTFSERLKDLEREGRIERVHKVPSEGRPKWIIRTTQAQGGE